MSVIDHQQLARSFRESVGFRWRPPFEVVQLPYVRWVSELPGLCRFAAFPFERATIPDGRHFTRAVSSHADEVVDYGWCGELTLWPGTAEELHLLRTSTRYDSCSHHDVFVAVRNDAHLERAFGLLHAEWKRWRRHGHLVRSSSGRSLDEAPLDWSKLVLEAKLAADVRSTIDAFAAGEPLYREAGIPWRRGMLMHGPPGNGKTMLCRAIFGHLKWPAITVAPSGDDEPTDLRGWLDEAEQLAPSIIVFEDLDSLITPKLPLSAFLNCIDGFEARSGVLLIATTNHPEKLDPAISSRPSRFDRIFQIGPPALREREHYLEQLFGARLQPGRARQLAAECEGFSMAFLKELFLHAALLAVARGGADPNEAELAEAHRAVRAHLSGASREFNPARPAGFALETTGLPRAEAKDGR